MIVKDIWDILIYYMIGRWIHSENIFSRTT